MDLVQNIVEWLDYKRDESSWWEAVDEECRRRDREPKTKQAVRVHVDRAMNFVSERVRCRRLYQ
jgi:hypothetical protein